MKSNSFVLGSFLALALTACSSSGGSDSSPKVNQFTDNSAANTTSGGNNTNANPSVNPSATNTTSVGNNTGAKKEVTGTWQYLGTEGNIKGVSDTDKLSKVVIGDNFTFDYDQEMSQIKSGNWVDNSGTLVINGKKMPNLVWNNTLSYARFGMITVENDPNSGYWGNSQAYLFHQGEVTPADALPTKDTNAVYQGIAFVVDGNNKNNRTHEAKSLFNVNFADKTVKGTISNIQIGKQKFDNIVLEGDISTQNGRNSFVGTTVGNTKMNGAFYGKNAEEMAGVFADVKQGVEGGFGAQKQGK